MMTTSPLLSRSPQRRGVALVAVLFLALTLFVLVAAMLFRTGAQKPVQSRLEEQARAIAVAKGAVQIAILKFKTLPTEFYRMDAARKNAATDTALADLWMADFDPGIATSPMARYLGQLPDRGNFRLEARVIDYSLQASAIGGYTEDYVRIVAEGSCLDEKQRIEELVKVTRFNSP